MVKLVFHIGAPKTGSSSIQSALFSARSTLQEDGIFLVGGDTAHADAMLHAAESLTDEGLAPDERRAALAGLLERAQLSGCESVLVSSESAFAATACLRLVDALPPDVEVCLVAYIRHQTEYLLASHVEFLRSARNNGETLCELVHRDVDQGGSDFLRNLRTLRGSPRVASLRVFSYADHRKDVVDHFASVVSEETGRTLTLAATRINVTPRTENVALLRRLDGLRTPRRQTPAVHSPVLRLAQTICNVPLGNQLPPMPQDLVDLVNARYDEGNTELGNEFGVNIVAEHGRRGDSAEADSGTWLPDPDAVAPEAVYVLLHAVLRTAVEICNASTRDWTPRFDPEDIDLMRGSRTTSLHSGVEQQCLQLVLRFLDSIGEEAVGAGEPTRSRTASGTLSGRLAERIRYFADCTATAELPPGEHLTTTERRFPMSVIDLLIRAGLVLHWELANFLPRGWERHITERETAFVETP